MLDRQKPEALFVEHLGWIDRVASINCEKHGVSDPEAEDFAAWVKERMIESDYAAFRDFRSESTLKTFLVTVVTRQFHDYWRERRGRWQPSAVAERLGTPAKELEALVYRDGYGLAQAGEMLRAAGRTELSDVELAHLLALLTVGTPLQHEFVHPGILGPDGFPISQEELRASPIITDVTSANELLVKMIRHDPESVYKLSSRQFEELVAELLHKQGYEVELTPPSRDGGFDMYAARKDAVGKVLFLVECKRYARDRPVGVEIVRGVYGVVQQEQATAGVVVTTSRFTKGATEFQRSVRHNLSLRDYVDLQTWLAVTEIEA